MNILGIETSCDETAAAIVNDKGEILANLVLSQLDEHRAFGGVVPEIAARAHADYLHDLIKGAMMDAGLRFDQLDGVAATCGPGLIGGVMVGMVSAKAIAAAHGLPFLAVNHLEGHALTARLTQPDLAFPYILFLVSGGHTQVLIAEGVGQYKLWGTTIDDAAGECFDKAAKIMGLPYPGGPNVQKIATECTDAEGAMARFPLPRPLIDKHKKDLTALDFSFSGLKTAVRTHVEKMPAEGDLNRKDIADLSYAFQKTVADIMGDRARRSIQRFKDEYGVENPTLVVSGGVAANSEIRARLTDVCAEYDAVMVAPPLNLCSDNAAMIAWAGVERLRLGLQDGLDFKARPRWPLDQLVGKP